MLIVALSMTMLVVAVELSGRWGFLAPSFHQQGSFSLLFDRDLLYRVQPHGRYDINAKGYRDYHDFSAIKPSGTKRILFLGDSFVMGMNVISTHTMPKMLEKMLGERFEVYNLGVHGYGPDQSLIQFQKEGVGYSPDMVVLNICAQNDYRDLEKNHLFDSDASGINVTRLPDNAVSRMVPPLHSAYLFQYLLWKYGLLSRDYASLFYTLFVDSYDVGMLQNPESQNSLRNVAIMRGILRKFRDELSARNIPFLVTVAPSFDNMIDDSMLRKSGIPKDKYFLIEDMTADICRKEGIACINLHQIFRRQAGEEPIFDPADHHFSRFGNSIAAEAIYNEVKRSRFTAVGQ